MIEFTLLVAQALGCLHLLIYYIRLCKFTVNLIGIAYTLRGWPVEGTSIINRIKAIWQLAMAGQGFILINTETEEERKWKQF